MKRHLFGTVGSLAVALLMIGCATDPTASLRGGGVETVVISRTYVEMDVGGSVRLNAKSYDAQGNVLPDLPEITVDDATVGALTIDEVTSGDPLPQTDFDIEAVGPGQLTITATAGGVSATSTIIAFPTAFPGAIAVNQTGALDELTISATSNIKFDPDNTVVTVNGGAVYTVSATADELVVRYLGLESGEATIGLANLVFLGSTAIASLTAAETPTLRGEPNEPQNNGLGTAPTVAPGAAFMGAVSGSDAVDLFKVVLTASATLSVSVGFGADPDIDIALYDSNGDWLGIYSWYDNPEEFSAALAAGTYFIEVFLYDGHGAAEPIWYDMSVTSP